jgi:hypothetical protein
MTSSTLFRRLFVGGIVVAAGLGLWAHWRSASAAGRLLVVGGERNGCHCTERIEP